VVRANQTTFERLPQQGLLEGDAYCSTGAENTRFRQLPGLLQPCLSGPPSTGPKISRWHHTLIALGVVLALLLLFFFLCCLQVMHNRREIIAEYEKNK
jgi:hypothetical protein